LNPEGFEGKPDLEKTFPTIRDTFGRMAMDDDETVALIGGGHAFGKTHGACTGCEGDACAGDSPMTDPQNPWAGKCGTGPGKGKGANTWTSGFEGSWSQTPTTWNNNYFKNLVNYEWSVTDGPG